MPKVVPILRDFPQQLEPGTHRQVTQLLEAADEAQAQGREDLRDSLVEKARQMVADLRAAWGLAT